MINLAIISNIRLYREGLIKILNDIPEINVICVTSSENRLLKCIETNRLDVVLLDMGMLSDFKALTSIAMQDNSIKVIVMGMSDNRDNYLVCAEAGITGYLSQESTIDELIEAIISVNNGDLYCPNDITKYILISIKNHNSNLVNKTHNGEMSAPSISGILTHREVEIIKLLAVGMSNKQIASSLTIELSTVKNHVHNILVKMGADNRSQAAYMLKNELNTH